MKKQSILITGATSGIGRAAALHFAGRGHRVFATGRNREKLAALEAERGADWDLQVFALDVTDPASVEAAADTVREANGGKPLDVLINNAGYGLPRPVELLEDEELRHQFETNVFGLVRVTRAFAGDMRRAGGGRILNVSSIGGRVSFPLFGAYHATKYALVALSDALRMEMAPFGVKVVLIEPGPIATGFADTSFDLIEQLSGRAGVYEPVLSRAGAIRGRTDRISASPRVVVRAMEHAITSRWPAHRYTMPWHSRGFMRALQWLPTWLSDRLWQRALGLTAQNLNRAQGSTQPMQVSVAK